jgi:hypothetical protein
VKWHKTQNERALVANGEKSQEKAEPSPDSGQAPKEESEPSKNSEQAPKEEWDLSKDSGQAPKEESEPSQNSGQAPKEECELSKDSGQAPKENREASPKTGDAPKQKRISSDDHDETPKKRRKTEDKGHPAEEPSAPEWGNSIYRVRFPIDTDRPTAPDGTFRPPFGWKYMYWMDEAVDVPEYVVPWEAFRALAEGFNLEQRYRKPFLDIWASEKDDRDLASLSLRMGVRKYEGGPLEMTEEEREAASMYHAFCFVKV